MIKKTKKKLKKVDLQQFLDSTGFLYKLSKQKITETDFTCIFEKDLTVKQKKDLSKRLGDLKSILNTFLAVRGFEKEYNAKIKQNIQRTHDFKKGTWNAKIIE